MTRRHEIGRMLDADRAPRGRRGRAWLELLCGAFLVPLIPADLARLTRLWRARIDPAT
jgi:hypothetical protein